jgi:osmotically-inducible protein OsmY
MAENNRNRQDSYRQPYDWNDDNNRHDQPNDEEPNYTISENRGYRSSHHSDMYSGMNSGDAGWKSRYEREMSNQRKGDFSANNPRRSGREENEYGSQNRGISSAYSDFGGDYGSRSGTRNLYDRGNEGVNRRDFQNRENRLGGGNYDSYGDRGRYDENRQNRHAGRGASYGQSPGRWGARGTSDDRDRDERGGSNQGTYGRPLNDDRSWWDRTTDEVSSWFGDEEAEKRRDRDRTAGGQYRGKGPRNYSRSDERIKEDISDRLSDDPFVDATDIEVTVSNGDVTLTGTVDHRSTKRRAEDLAESVSSVKNVENRLRVSQPASGMNQPSGTSTAQSSSPVPGPDRNKSRESGYANK